MSHCAGRRYPTPARTYYVDATGGGANSGNSEHAALQTIAQANALTLKPGDRMLFKRGETWGTTRFLPPASGTYSRPITFSTYGAGADPIFSGTSSGAMQINVKSHLRFIGVATGNAASANYGIQLLAFNAGELAENLLFENCTFSTAAIAGFIANGGTHGGIRQLRFVNCVAHHCGQQGFHLYSSGSGLTCRDVEFIDCTAHTNGVTAAQHHGWYVAYSDGVRTRRCVAHDNVGHGFQWQGGVTNLLMDSCKSYDNDSQGVWLSGLLAGGVNYFVNNLVYGNADSGFEISASVAAANILHNTIVNNGAGASGSRQGVCLYDGAAGVVFKNNLVKQDEAVVGQYRNCIKATTADELGAAQGNVLNYNVYQYDNSYSGYAFNVAGTEKTLAQWQAYSGSQDANSINADPTFVTEYTDLHLAVGSEGIGDGDATVGVLQDYDGRTRGAAVDIGAYEYVA